MIVWLLIGIPVGIVSAIRRRSVLDRVAMGLALLAISAPVYWLGLVSLYCSPRTSARSRSSPGPGSYEPLTEDPARGSAR